MLLCAGASPPDLWAACFRLLRVVATNCGELNAFLINLNEQRGNKERNNGHTAGAAALPAPGPLLVVLNHLSSLAHRNQAVMAGQQQLPQGQGQGVQTATNTQAAMIKVRRFMMWCDPGPWLSLRSHGVLGNEERAVATALQLKQGPSCLLAQELEQQQ